MIPEKECLRHVNVTMHFSLTRSNEERHLAREPLEVLNSLGYPYFEKKMPKRRAWKAAMKPQGR